MRISAIFLAVFALSSTATAGVEHSFKPALLNSKESGRTIGARFALRYDHQVDTDKMAWHFAAGTKGTIAAKERANSENMGADVSASIDRRFGGTVVIDPTRPIDPNAPPSPPPAAPWELLANAELRVAFEADQPFDETQIKFGPRLGFVQTERIGPRALIPSVHASYDRVKVLESKLLKSLGVTDDTFWRLELAASWVWNPFEKTEQAGGALTPISLHADVRYFRSYDQPTAVKAANQDDNLYTAGTIQYGLGNLKRLHAVYVTVAHGRLPPSTKEDTTVFLGVVLFGK